jgi:ABC-2 type transport system ATP-binding protein
MELENIVSPLENILGDRFELIGSTKKNGILSARIKVRGHVNANELLQQVMSGAQIVSFHELIPSMNDIFIKNVTGHFPFKKEESAED